MTETKNIPCYNRCIFPNIYLLKTYRALVQSFEISINFVKVVF